MHLICSHRPDMRILHRFQIYMIEEHADHQLVCQKVGCALSIWFGHSKVRTKPAILIDINLSKSKEQWVGYFLLKSLIEAVGINEACN